MRVSVIRVRYETHGVYVLLDTGVDVCPSCGYCKGRFCVRPESKSCPTQTVYFKYVTDLENDRKCYRCSGSVGMIGEEAYVVTKNRSDKATKCDLCTLDCTDKLDCFAGTLDNNYLRRIHIPTEKKVFINLTQDRGTKQEYEIDKKERRCYT